MIDPASMLYPAGRIHPDLLPGADLTADIAEWIAEAYGQDRVAALETEAAQDAAARKWVEYRAFDAACIALNSNPAAADQKDQGSSRYEKDQRETVCSLAASALAEFEALAPVDSDVRPVGAQSRTVSHRFVW